MKIGISKTRFVAFPNYTPFNSRVGRTIDAHNLDGGEFTLVHPLNLSIAPGLWIKNEQVRKPSKTEWLLIGYLVAKSSLKVRWYHLRKVIKP